MDETSKTAARDENLKAAFAQLLRINLIAFVIWCVGATMVLSGFLIPYSNGIFSSSVIAPAYLVALVPALSYWRKSVAIVATSDLREQLTKYDKLRNSQSALGALTIVGAVAAIPASIILVQMVPVGWAILINLFSGGFITLGLNQVHRRVSYYRAQPSEVASSTDAGAAGDPETLATPNPYKPLGDVLPPEMKRPIGRGFVWGGGVTILGINLLQELTTFAAIRRYGMQNGSIMDFASSMTLGLNQLFDVVVLSTIGVLLLVLALINQARVKDKKTNLAAIAVVVAGLVIFPGGISTVLAGVAGPSDELVETRTQAKDSTETIQAIMNSGPVPGFEGVYEEFYDCMPEGCSDSLMRLANEIGPEARTGDYCEELISFGAAIGLTTYSIAPYNDAIGLDSASAQSDCVKTLDAIDVAEAQQYQAYSENFVMEGTAAVGALAPIRFVVMQAIDGNLDDNPGYHTYFLEITTTFQTGEYQAPGSGLSKGTVEINDLLDLIGQQRLANPDRKPMDRAFMEEILSTYPHEIEMTLIENESGEIHRIQLTTSDGAAMCLSVEPWESDPFNEGIPDPGMGYGLGYMESLEVLRGFGNAVEGSCG